MSTIAAKTDFLRQKGLVSPELVASTKIVLIGDGGIGSPTAFALAKIGIVDLTIIDADTVMAHNLPSTMFRHEDIGIAKVLASKQILASFTDAKVVAVPEMFDGSQPLEGVVISAVDSMTARIAMWESVRYNPLVPLYIDARMGAELLMIFTLDPCDPEMVERYEKTLYTSAQAAQVACTEKSIFYNVLVIAGLICSNVKKYLVNQPLKFKIVFDLVNLIFVVE